MQNDTLIKKMTFQEQFLADVLHGLSKPLKRISSMYFYDDAGDKIFQEIMNLDEYYLPEVELEILKTQASQILEGFESEDFDVVELGAGDGSKTVHFLEQLYVTGKNFRYCPLDISSDVLVTNTNLMIEQLPGIKVNPLVGDYFKTLATIDQSKPKILMFMGSNIGNYENGAAVKFLKKLKENMRPGDRLMVGIDLQKNPKTILAAYDDRKGVTRRFNLNLLKRINRELGANFDLDYFDHYAFYNPLTGITYSFLVSMRNQVVSIGGRDFNFNNGEIIHTEVSQKYNFLQIEQLRADASFTSVRHHVDSRGYYTISIFEDK